MCIRDRSKSRSAFRRDCDRIIHSTAFRRLKHKTQVFVFDEGDHYRTRLTHTLEVTQVARSLARRLHLDEDLAEALALAHDLGHPPFGHAGERALDACLSAVGGFDHNAQTLRIVTALERRYPNFDGLNPVSYTHLITDGRFSGATRGFCVGHIGPEAAVGGPIALLRDGDIVKLDGEKGTLDVELTKDELDRRAKEWKPRPEEFTSGYLWKYAQQVGSARYGALTHPGAAAEKACYADI